MFVALCCLRGGRTGVDRLLGGESPGQSVDEHGEHDRVQREPDSLARLCGGEESGARRVVIDLAGAAFIDSTVLGVLLKALTRLDAGGGELVLVSDDRRILKLLEVTGLGRVFRIEPTLTDAIAVLVRPEFVSEGTA